MLLKGLGEFSERGSNFGSWRWAEVGGVSSLIFEIRRLWVGSSCGKKFEIGGWEVGGELLLLEKGG